MGNEYIFHITMKVNIRNFGAKKIYVISKEGDHKRKSDFIKAWESFDGFDYEFVDAIMTDDIDLKLLYNSGIISDTFRDPNKCLSKTVISVFLSHKKVWDIIWKNGAKNQYKDMYMILEDDARPTNFFTESIYDGSFKKIINFIKKTYVSCFYWGKWRSEIRGRYVNKNIINPERGFNISGVSYSILPSLAYTLLSNSSPINCAQDVLVEQIAEIDHTYSPHNSFILQQAILLDKWIMEKDDIDFVYSSTTTRNELIYGELSDDDPYVGISLDIKDFVESVHQTETDFIIKLNFNKESSLI